MLHFPAITTWMISSSRLRLTRLNVIGWLVLLAALAGCSNLPQAVHHPAPQFSLNTQVFEQAGCSPDSSGRISCPVENLIAQAGCAQISEPGEFLGGLEPAYPLNICWLTPPLGERPQPDEYLYSSGCLLPEYVRYVVFKDGGFQVLRNQAELKAAYAPITSKDEALSYALAATGLGAYFDQQPVPGMRYFTDRLEDSHVEAVPGGYQVLLYHYQFCGCGPHTTSAVLYQVSQDGGLQELSREPVFEDPEQDTLCID